MEASQLELNDIVFIMVVVLTHTNFGQYQLKM